MKCTTAHPNTGMSDQESKLNEALNKVFPGDNVDGVNSNYLDIRQNKEFINFFGNWADKNNPEDYDALLEHADNTAVFDEIGEPKLHYDITGNPYILNLQGRRKYIKPLFDTISSADINKVVNTITGDFISNNENQYNLEEFIDDKFNADIALVEKQIELYGKNVKKIKVTDVASKKLKDNKRKILLQNKAKLKKLKSIEDSPNLKALLKKRILARLEKYNFKYTEDIDDKESYSEEYNDINNFIKDSSEDSNRAINDPKILSFLSSIPVFENYNTDVNKQRRKANFLLSSTQYMDQNAVWGMLESIFADVLPTSKNKDVFVNFLTALRETAKNTKQPELNYISNFLDDLDNQVENPGEFRTKFVAAFFKSNQNYLITQVTQDKITDKQGDSRYVTTFKIIDPAIKNNKVGKLANQYIETITNTKRFTTLRDFNVAKKKLLEGYDTETLSGGTTRIKGYNDIKNTSDYNSYYEFLNELLNDTLGLNISPEVLEYYMDSKTVDSFKPLRDEIEVFLENEIKSKTLNDYTLEYPEGEFDILAELRVNYSGKNGSPEAKDAFKERLMANGSFLKSIAAAAKIFSHDVSETSFMVGGSQRWAYSYTSGLHLEIGKWKNGDLSSLKRLSNRGLRFVDHLLSDGSANDKVNMLQIYTNSEIKKKNDSAPVLHKKITEIDYHLDNFVKMFNSMDEFYEETTDKLQGKGAKRQKKLKQLKNYIMYNFGADKNSLFAIFGLPNPTEGMQVYDPKTKQILPELKSVLNDYIAGELNLADKASQDIQAYFDADNKKEFLMNNLIDGYHYNTDKDIEKEDLTPEDFAAGNYHKIGIFTSSLEKFKKEKPDKARLLYDTSRGYPVIHSNFYSQQGDSRSNKSLDVLMGYVYNDINDIIQKNYNYLSNITLIRKEVVDETTGESTFEEVKLFEVENNMRTGEMEMSIYEYIISGFLVNYELSNIFNGHASYYAQKKEDDINLTDFLKRAPAVATDGKYLHHRQSNESKTYTDYDGKTHTVEDKDDSIVVAVVNNIDIKESTHSKLISKATGQKMTFKHELADAQGYVSSEHFRDLIERTYGWNDVDTKNYNELNDPDHKITDENIKWIKTAGKSFTPLKMVHFEVLDKLHPNQDAGVLQHGMPVYFKYSLAPLFPAMTNGTEMQKIVDQMEEQGVEQLVFKSGSKASNATPTTLHSLNEDGSYNGVNPDLRLNPFILDSARSKMQVELPTKLDKDTKLGMQSVKNILTNLDLEDGTKAYKLYDKKNKKYTYHTGAEIYDKINSTAINMLQAQLEDVLKEMGYHTRDLRDENGDIVYEADNKTSKKVKGFSREKVKKLLIKQMDIETESDLIHMLHTDLPLEAIPNFGQRAFPVIASFIQKQAGKIHTNGSSVVQVANVGYDRLSQEDADGIFYFEEQTKLEPPLPVTDSKTGEILYFDPETGKKSSKEEGGVMHIQKSKILLPFASIFQKTGMSYNEFKKAYTANKIDPEIFKNILGYRVPNQAMSSNDSFEVVGILPPIAGDQAVVYHEITAKTGSDFDIDKMYLALPNFKVKFKEGKKLRQKLKQVGVDKKFATKILKEENFYLDDPVDNPVGDPVMDLFNYVSNNKDIIDNPDLLDKIAEIDDITLEVEDVTYTTEGQKGLQNEFIELMNSILESGKSYNDLMSPLDSDIIKDTIHKIDYLKDVAAGEYTPDNNLSEKDNIKAHAEEKSETGLEQMFPVSLLKSRVDVLEAKTLISIMANNMTDLGESQKVDFGLKYPLGIVNENNAVANSLAREYLLNQDNNAEMKLSKIVSYLMNASVDAAKDNYIISGNFTSYTANGAMLMTRLGMPLDDLFTVLMNKEILEFSKYKTYQRAKLSDFAFDYNQEQLDKWSTAVLQKMAKNNWNIFEVVSREDFLNNNSEKKEDILGYWNLIQTMGKEFNDSVVAMKSESNGAGKNIPEFMALKNRIAKVMNGTTTNATHKWFKNGLNQTNRKFNDDIANDPDAKMLGVMANNTLFLMEELSKDLFIETTPNVQEAVNNILTGLGKPLETNIDSIKLIYNYLYPQLLHNTGHRVYDFAATGDPQERMNYLLQEFPRKLQRYKMNSDNKFLNQLDITTNKKRNLISFPNYKNFAVQDKLDFKEALTEMMNDDRINEPNSEYYDLVHDLVQYAFLTTGFKSTYYSFNDYLPASYFLDSMHGKVVQEYIEKLNNTTANVINHTQAMTLMAKTHYNNFKIVKNLSSKMKGDEEGKNIRSDKPITNKATLEKLRIDEDSYAPFFKKSKNSTLYMLTGRETIKKKTYPVYKRISKIDNKDFNTYFFYDIETGLSLDNVPYVSPVDKLYEDVPNYINTAITESTTKC